MKMGIILVKMKNDYCFNIYILNNQTLAMINGGHMMTIPWFIPQNLSEFLGIIGIKAYRVPADSAEP